MATDYSGNRQSRQPVPESRYRDPVASAPPPDTNFNDQQSSQHSSTGHAATEPMTHRSGRDEFVKKLTVRTNAVFPVTKTIVCNRHNCRTFTRLLEECCEKLGTTKCVTSLRTMSGKYAHSLDEVQSHKTYTAICQNERYVPAPLPGTYPRRLEPIVDIPTAKLPPRSNRAFANVNCRFYDQENYRTRSVHVYANGEYRKKPAKVLIDGRTLRMPRPVDCVLRAAEERLGIRAKKLYNLDTKMKIESIDELQNDMSVVAAASNERLKLQESYGNIPRTFVTGPVHSSEFGMPQMTRMNNHRPLPAISRSREEVDDNSQRASRSRSVPSRPKAPSRPTSEPRPVPHSPTPPKSPKTTTRASREPTKKKQPTKKPQPQKSEEAADDENEKKEENEIAVEEQKEACEETEQTDEPAAAEPVSTAAEEENQDVEDETEKDGKREEEAATKIQAGFRGHQAREQVRKMKSQAEDMPPAEEEDKVDEEKQDEFGGEEEKMEEEKQDDIGGEEKMDEEEKTTESDDDKMREEEAATKIQAGFRGHQAREQVRKMKSEAQESPTEEEEKKIDDEEKQNEEEEDEDRLQKETEAATKIQAGYRGFKVRKGLAAEKGGPDPCENNDEAKEEEEKEVGEEEEKVEEEQEKNEEDDRKNQEEEAAARIQAGFRGYKVRKGLAEKKTEQNGAVDEEEEHEEEKTSEDDQKAQTEAATKIQAGFRGHQARKQVKAMKEESNTQNGVENGEDELKAEADAAAAEAAEETVAAAEMAAETEAEAQ